MGSVDDPAGVDSSNIALAGKPADAAALVPERFRDIDGSKAGDISVPLRGAGRIRAMCHVRKCSMHGRNVKGASNGYFV